MAKTTLNINYDKLDAYDRIIVGFSGGKDSVACVLSILEERPDLRDRVVLWHHEIDGVDHDRPGAGSGLFDWDCTPAYCRAFAEALGLPLRHQWRDKGFEGEMLREDSSTAGVYYEDDDGQVKYLEPQRPGKNCKCGHKFGGDVWMNERGQWTGSETECPECGKARRGLSTRRKLPQVSADLSVRWCSAYLKIDVAKRVINATQEGQVLLVTGERAEESGARARYHQGEVVSRSKKRVVHQWRPVHAWEETQVWEIMRRWKINPHPCYHLGFGRCSCLGCIFGNADQWASAARINPGQIARIAEFEQEFGLTLKRKENLGDLIARGRVYEQVDALPRQLELARGNRYPADDVIVAGEWLLPAGAFRECGGPT